MSRDALGFISTKFQAKWTIQGPFWTNLGFLIFRKPNLEQARGSAWTRDGVQPGPGTVCLGPTWIHLGPIWGPILRDPFRGIGRGPGTHWRPKADILEAEG